MTKTKKSTHGGRREGAGRPALNPEGNAKFLTTTIPGPLIEKLDAIAGKWDLSRSAALARIIREYRARR